MNRKYGKIDETSKIDFLKFNIFILLFLTSLFFSCFAKKTKTQEETSKSKNGLIGRARPVEVREKISRALKGKKKTSISWLKGLKGPNHPCYKHGKGKRRVPPEDQDLYNAWLQGIYQAWNFRCALTGVSNEPLAAHHLNSWDSFVDQRYELSNGVLLSKSVHTFFHKIYGNGKNTRIQFDHFVEVYFKNNDNEWNRRLKNINEENHQPNLNIQKILEQQKTKKEKSFEDFSNLLKKRNHQYVSGCYENIHSEVCIYCPSHDIFHSTTFHNYKRSKTGMSCCGRIRQIQASQSYVRDPKTGRFRDFTS